MKVTRLGPIAVFATLVLGTGTIRAQNDGGNVATGGFTSTVSMEGIGPLRPSLGSGATTIGAGQFVQILETKAGRSTAKPIRTFRFSENLTAVVDVTHTLELTIDASLAGTTNLKKISVEASAEGPLRITPLPQIVPKNTPRKLAWTMGGTSGGSLRLDGHAAGLEPGDQIRFRVSITTTGPNDESLTRELSMFVEFRSFGLVHQESDSFVFVRSAQSSSWDSRPGATAAFGWQARDDFFLGQGWWNFVSPRVGVNVTLLDFDKDETIEAGVGVAFTFIRGGIIIGTGWNLTTSFSKRRYVYLGISFLNIANVIKGALGPNETP